MTPPFDDDAREIEAVRPCVLYRCRRCGVLEAVDVPHPVITIRESIEHRATLRMHECADGPGVYGVADLIGSGGSGRPRPLEAPVGRLVGADRCDP